MAAAPLPQRPERRPRGPHIWAPGAVRLGRRSLSFSLGWPALAAELTRGAGGSVRGGAGSGRRGGGSVAPGPAARVDSRRWRPVFPLVPAAGVQGGWAMPAHAEMHDSSSLPHADLRSKPCCRQIPVLVLRFSAEEDEEVFWRDCVLWPGAGLKT